MSTITSYQNLKAKIESCKIPNVGKRNLMVLRGTIPVPYRTNTYNIPVIIWIPHNHPMSAPLCWVDPTNDMTIKVSKSVDSNGKIYLPYLSEWAPSNSDLLGAIQVMIITFSESMPLYAKPKGSSVQPPAMSESQPSMPNTSVAGNSNNVTVNPPYPTTYNSHPPYPGGYSYPAVNPVMPPPYPQPQQQMPYPPVTSSQQPSLPYSNYGYTPATLSSNSQPAIPQQQQSNIGLNSASTGPTNFDTIQPKHFRDSLETAVADEIRKNVKEIEETSKAEIQVLKNTGKF